MATIKKRGDSYRIRVSAGFDGQGRRIVKSMTWKPEAGMTERKTQKALNEAAVLFEKHVKTGQFLDGSVTFAEFAERWFSDYAEVQLQPGTLIGYRVMLPQVNASIGHIKLAKLQPHHIIEFLKNLSENGVRRDGKYSALSVVKATLKDKEITQVQLAAICGQTTALTSRCVTGQNVSYKTAAAVCDTLGLKLDEAFIYHGKSGLSGNTQLHYYHFLQSVLSTAVEWQVIPDNPCNRVKAPKKDTPPQAVLTVEEAQRLIECLDTESVLHHAAVLLLLYSGARRSELYGLEWSDVDMKKLQISIHRTWKRGKDGIFGYYPCKNESSERVVALPDCCRTLLTELRLHQNAQRLKCGDFWKDSKALLITEDGAHASPDELTEWFRAFCRKNGFPESVHIHTLRHTSATLQIVNAHQNIRSVSARLGHSQTSTTLNIYAHAVQSADAKAAEALGELLPLKRENI